MISLHDATGRYTAEGILGYSVAMGLLPCTVSMLGVTSAMFAVWSLPANAYIGYKAWKFYSERTDKNAQSVFLSSLWYLPLLMALMVIHSSRWEQEVNTEKESMFSQVQTHINAARQVLKTYCVHETIKSHKIEEGKQVANTSEDNHAETALIKSYVRKQCPIVNFETGAETAAKDFTKSKDTAEVASQEQQ